MNETQIDIVIDYLKEDLKYLKEQQDYLEIAEAIIRANVKEEICEDVIPIIIDRLGFIKRDD